MRKLKSVNWSALLPDAIQARIELERLATMRDWERVREARMRADAVYKEMAGKYGYIDFNRASAPTLYSPNRMSTEALSSFSQFFGPR